MLKRLTCLSTAMLLLFAVAGCSKEEAAKPEAKPEATTPEAAKPETPKPPATAELPDVAAKLAKADALDGKTDKVISKCAGCKFGMDGKPEHSVTAAGYTFHFCSDKCKVDFAKDTTKAVNDLVVP